MAGRLQNRFGEFLRFFRYLPRLYRGHVLECQRRFHDQPESNILFFNRKQFLIAPNDVNTFRTWLGFFAEPACAEEVKRFLEIRRGCQRFLDIGAGQGLFSAIFARSATGPGQILAVEPTERYASIYRETLARNAATDMSWTLEQVALLDQVKKTQLADPKFDGFFDHIPDSASPQQAIEMCTLDELCSRHQFSPDLIKMDVDGFEYEILQGSPDFLARHKPRVHLEFHFADLRRRGKDAHQLLEQVLKTHRIAHALPARYHHAPVARFSLYPKD